MRTVGGGRIGSATGILFVCYRKDGTLTTGPGDQFPAFFSPDRANGPGANVGIQRGRDGGRGDDLVVRNDGSRGRGILLDAERKGSDRPGGG
jgi:hypothetical protein